MKHVVFIMSDTGGGHRAAAEAIRDALYARYPGQFTAELVDAWKHYTPFPFNYAPETYGPTIKYGKLGWWAGYNVTNGRFRSKVATASLYAIINKHIKRMILEHPADVIVCVHSVFVRPVLRAFRTIGRRTPFVTVVTDLVSTHMFWYDPGVDRCLVPTEPAYQRGLLAGLRPDQMRITGLPVHPDFAARLLDKGGARWELGWDLEMPTVLIVGGGAGMGPMVRIAKAVDEMAPPYCQIAVIAGRNKSLKAKLETLPWRHKAFIYPYVTNMPVMMAAADILVTKAGPGTISEACIAGLPMVLSGAIPGQEEGNVGYVVDHGAGVYAPSPKKVGRVVREWLEAGPDSLAKRSAASRALGRPDAVWDIAEEVYYYAHRPYVPQSHDRSGYRREGTRVA